LPTVTLPARQSQLIRHSIYKQHGTTNKLGRPFARQNAATTIKLSISNGRQNVADINSAKNKKRFAATGQNTATESLSFNDWTNAFIEVNAA